MSTISRKPVPSPSVATGSPKLENVPNLPQNTSDHEFIKDIEKGGIEERPRRVSTDADLNPPVPAYRRDFTGNEDIGKDGFAFEKPRTFQFKNLKPNFKTTGLGVWAQSNRFSQRQGQELGGQKRYFGVRRKYFLLGVLALVVIILALAIGLGVGLKANKGSQNIPLPNNREVHTGDLTYYDPGLGACGITNSASDDIVAVSHLLFDAVQTGSNPNQNPLCGKKIRASRFNEKSGSQRSVDLTVTDRCTGCKATDIDVTTSVFDQLADRDSGRVVTTWAWLDVDL